MNQLLVLALLSALCLESVTAKGPEFKDKSFLLWQATDSTQYLRACAGLDENGDLRLVKYDVVHYLPSSPTGDDGGMSVTPSIETRSLKGARFQLVDGKPLTKSQFEKRFQQAANASRTEKHRPVREHHALILLIENGRTIPRHIESVFRPDLPIVTLPRTEKVATRVSKPQGSEQDIVPVP